MKLCFSDGLTSSEEFLSILGLICGLDRVSFNFPILLQVLCVLIDLESETYDFFRQSVSVHSRSVIRVFPIEQVQMCFATAKLRVIPIVNLNVKF